MRANDWRCNAGYGGKKFEFTFDPRAIISKHIAWDGYKGSSDTTSWSIPEPDNYNFAILAAKPIEYPGVNDQCWFKWEEFWLSCYYDHSLEYIDFIRYTFTQDFIAYWHPRRKIKPKIRERLLDRDIRKNIISLPENHILWYQNHYTGLKYKCDDFDTIVEKYIGIPYPATEDLEPIRE